MAERDGETAPSTRARQQEREESSREWEKATEGHSWVEMWTAGGRKGGLSRGSGASESCRGSGKVLKTGNPLARRQLPP